MGVQREGGGWWSYSGVRRGWVVVERTKREKDIALGYFHENESPSKEERPGNSGEMEAALAGAVSGGQSGVLAARAQKTGGASASAFPHKVRMSGIN